MQRAAISNVNNSHRYLEPGVVTRRVMNPAVAWLTRRGISVWGSRVLAVRGRTSGEWRYTPVNVLTVDGVRYLVAPRGTTQWVRNLRAAGTGQLRVGRRTETFTAVELDDAAKPSILRPYLRRWFMEVGVFFDGVSADSSDAELLAAAPSHPVFRLAETAATTAAGTDAAETNTAGTDAAPA